MVYNSTDTTVSQSTFTSNNATNGGAVYLEVTLIHAFDSQQPAASRMPLLRFATELCRCAILSMCMRTSSQAM